jgi:hypothetical protein
MKRPAETAGLAGAAALLIARVAGVHDPGTITAIGVIIGAIPGGITWLVELLRGDPQLRE